MSGSGLRSERTAGAAGAEAASVGDSAAAGAVPGAAAVEAG
jgi:hypothetical protein